MATREEAIAQKRGAAPIETKVWNYINLPDAETAVEYVNAEPAQGAGEVSMTNRPDGSVDVYYFTTKVEEPS
jgi:hypothetical protein